MGAQSYLIASILKMVLSQRLIRVLCENCKVFDKESNNYKSIGCKKCNLTGYHKRKVVNEILEINDALSQMISKNISVLDILKYAKKYDFKTLEENGMKLVKNGTTTLGEYYSKI
jgi:type II secretory ATPase GspE/PulE/Tfp pilus assembly ATPase PilB-like protein